MKRPLRTGILPAVMLMLAVTALQAQMFPVELITVPGADPQPNGPTYDFEIGRHEATNQQYMTFLNDAEFHNEEQNPGFGNERGDHLKFRQPPFGGDVGLVVGDSSDIDAVFDISRSLLTYNDALPVGQRFGVVSGKEDHPIAGASWIGAVKFLNWLTIDQGLGLAARCYGEGDTEFDWFPLAVGDEIGGTQQMTNAVRDLTEAERLDWVTNYRGFRLPMDQGGILVGATNAVPRPYNEWYKAAAWDPAAPDVPRLVFPGFPFEEHTVPADHWVHGFGRDPLTNPDCNFRDSGDPFDNPDPAVIATTPGGYYDGTDHGGVFQTTANDNPYGIEDMSGNVWEFLNDQVEITDSMTPDRAIGGGSYRSNVRQVSVANRGDIGPGTTRPVVGFRILRVPEAACIVPAGSPELTLSKSGTDLQLAWTEPADATAYDVVRGELDTLRSSGGDYNSATVECLVDDAMTSSLIYSGDPPSGEAYWFLVRVADCGGGSFDSLGAQQAGSRDGGVEASAGACLPFAAFDLQTIAATGDEPPERPGESFSFFTDPDLNDAGEVTFKGNFDGPASGNEGIYRWDPVGELLERVVDDSFDDSPPGQSGATSWTSFGPPVMNESGSVLFHGNFSFGDNSQGLYVFTDLSDTVIFDDSPTQPVPGQPTANGFTVFPFTAGVMPLLSENEFGGTTARYFDAGFVQREGLYLGDSLSGIVRVADETLAPPGQPASFFQTFDWFMSTNAGGDLAFHATYSNGGHGMYCYIRNSASLVRIADTRMLPPGQTSPSKFSSIDGSPSMNAGGSVAFRAFYGNGNGNQGLYFGDGVGALSLAVDNSGALGVPGKPGESFVDFGHPAMNDAGDLLFTAVTTSGFGVYGLVQGSLVKIFDEDDAVPQQLGATFFAVGNLSLSAQGHVAFTARYSGGIGDEGIYLYDGSQLRRVIDESDLSFGGTISNLHMLTTTGSSGGTDGKPNALSNSDSVVFRVTLSGGDDVIVAATLRP